MTVRRAALVLFAYVALGALLTRPLLELSATHIANDPYDPVLNATVLAWNATTMPLTEAWWHTPMFYPATGVTTFTENLLGIAPISVPIQWITGNALLAYNLAVFAAWPLCAFTAYLLVRRLTGRDDAAFVAGLAYGFTPYRVSETSHLQMLSAYYLPLILLGLHGYVDTRRRSWLLLFAAAWILQSLANAYLMLFGGVMIGVWLLYFATTRATWRTLPPIAITGAIATLPLLLIMLRYRSEHAIHGLRRATVAPADIAYPFDIWYQASSALAVWGRILPVGSDNHFPGMTALLVAIAGIILAVFAARRIAPVPGVSRALRLVLAGLAVTGVAAAVALYAHGHFHGEIAGNRWRMTNASRPLWIAAVAGTLFAIATPWLRAAIARRSRLLFYAAATIGFAVLACGGALMKGTDVVLSPAPYFYLLQVPGFSEVRVPARFWMIGAMCLGVTAGLSLPYVQAAWRRGRTLAPALAAIGLLADGWISMPMAEGPRLLPNAEPAWRTTPFVELPIGPGFDNGPGYRAVLIGRRSINGASGYDPNHYYPMIEGLRALDHETLRAMSTFGAFDVVIDLTNESGAEYLEYLTAMREAKPISRSTKHAVFEIPQRDAPPDLGPALPIIGVRANAGPDALIADGEFATYWADGPQRPGQFVLADLGKAAAVAGVSMAFGEFAGDFPRYLVIDTSTDGLDWTTAWEGNAAAAAYRSAVLQPLQSRAQFAFAARLARFVRLRQTATHKNLWRIHDLQIHEPR